MKLESLDNWETLEELGRGGMGTVFLAKNIHTGKHAALKVAHDFHPSLAKSLRREIAALASVDHPHVVKVLARGGGQERPWYAMEWLQGESLRMRFYAQREALTLAPTTIDFEEAMSLPMFWADVSSHHHQASSPSAKRLQDRETWREDFIALAQACDALGALHEQGVVHGDLKPEHILLEERGAVLLDFGLASHSASAQHRAMLHAQNFQAGTLMYMSPEQVKGQRIDARTDTFALGCMLYEYLTGVPPFVASDLGSLAALHARGAYTPASELCADLPEKLNQLLELALEVNPSKRLGYAEDFGALLREVAGEAQDWDRAPRYTYFLPSRLHGRDDEMTTLEGWLEADETVDSMVVLGSQGMGKSHIAHDLGQVARGLGWRVESVRLSETKTLTEFSRVLQEHVLGQIRPGDNAVGGVQHVLESLKSPQGALLIVDDAHWLDTMSVKLLRSKVLFEQWDTGVIRVLLCGKPEHEHLHVGEPMVLEPLGDHHLLEVVQSVLVKPPLSSEFYRTLAHEAQGNPMAVLAMMSSYVHQGFLSRKLLQTWSIQGEIPKMDQTLPKLERMLRGVWHTLKDEAREFVQVLGLSGGGLDRVLCLSHPSWLHGAEHLMLQGILTDHGDRFVLNQRALGEVAVAATSKERTMQLHRALLATYKERATEQEPLNLKAARHLFALGEVEQAKSLILDRVRQFKATFESMAMVRALSFYFELFPEPASDKDVRWMAELGAAYNQENDQDMSLKSLERARAWNLRFQSDETLRFIMLGQAIACPGTGEIKRLGELLDQVVEVPGFGEGEAGAWEKTTYSMMSGVRGWYEEGLDKAQEHFEHATQQSTPGTRLHARALLTLALVFARKGEVQQALEHLAPAAKVFQEVGDQFGLSRVLATQAGLLHLEGFCAEAASQFDRIMTLYQGNEKWSSLALSLRNAASSYMSLGEFAKAKDRAERAVQLYLINMNENIGACLGMLATIHEVQGNHQQADLLMERGKQMLLRLEDHHSWIYIRASELNLAYLRRDHARCIQVIAQMKEDHKSQDNHLFAVQSLISVAIFWRHIERWDDHAKELEGLDTMTRDGSNYARMLFLAEQGLAQHHQGEIESAKATLNTIMSMKKEGQTLRALALFPNPLEDLQAALAAHR